MESLSRREFLAGSVLTVLGAPDVRAAQRKFHLNYLRIVPDGGESQIDTWDPKPSAPKEIRGQLCSIPTAITGIRVSEVYPRMAKLMGKTTLLRARRAKHLLHLPAMQQMLRRTQSDHRLSEHAKRQGGLPPMYMETEGLIEAKDYRKEAYGVGKLAIEMHWWRGKERFMMQDFGEHDEAATKRRMALLGALDKRGTPEAEAFFRKQEEAARLAALLRNGVDLKEKDIAAYGNNPIGIGVLTMREVVRKRIAGTVVFRAGNWDDHWDLYTNLRPRAAMMDRALSALVTDIEDGVLEDTVVEYGAEFGRTPRINGEGGRDHFAWSSGLLFGSGIRQGYVHGATDKRGDGMSGIIGTDECADIAFEAVSRKPDIAKRVLMPPVFRKAG